MKGDDKAAIEAKTSELGEKSGKLAERVYKEQAEQGAAEGAAAAGRRCRRRRQMMSSMPSLKK